MCEDEWRYNIAISNDLSKHHDVDWVFSFHQYQYFLWEQSKLMIVLSSPEIFLNHFCLEGLICFCINLHVLLNV